MVNLSTGLANSPLFPCTLAGVPSTGGSSSASAFLRTSIHETRPLTRTSPMVHGEFSYGFSLFALYHGNSEFSPWMKSRDDDRCGEGSSLLVVVCAWSALLFSRWPCLTASRVSSSMHPAPANKQNARWRKMHKPNAALSDTTPNDAKLIWVSEVEPSPVRQLERRGNVELQVRDGSREASAASIGLQENLCWHTVLRHGVL